MKISQILSSKKITVSCELFPPKQGGELQHSREVVAATAALGPDFISVTYGASGSTAGFTAELAEEIEKRGVPALAHVTCVSSDRDSLREYLSKLSSRGVENVLALRGDMPVGQEPKRVFRYASDLASEIRSVGGFCVGGACYPECHPESASVDSDLEALKIKTESGCEFLTTQMFFENSKMYSFLDRLRKKGVSVPVLAGIMPVTNVRQLERTASLSGTALPKELLDAADKYSGDPVSMRSAGVAFAAAQIKDLIANGVCNIHIYTMNKPDIAGEIIADLSETVR